MMIPQISPLGMNFIQLNATSIQTNTPPPLLSSLAIMDPIPVPVSGSLEVNDSSGGVVYELSLPGPGEIIFNNISPSSILVTEIKILDAQPVTFTNGFPNLPVFINIIDENRNVIFDQLLEPLQSALFRTNAQGVLSLFIMGSGIGYIVLGTFMKLIDPVIPGSDIVITPALNGSRVALFNNSEGGSVNIVLDPSLLTSTISFFLSVVTVLRPIIITNDTGVPINLNISGIGSVTMVPNTPSQSMSLVGVEVLMGNITISGPTREVTGVATVHKQFLFDSPIMDLSKINPNEDIRAQNSNGSQIEALVSAFASTKEYAIFVIDGSNFAIVNDSKFPLDVTISVITAVNVSRIESTSRQGIVQPGEGARVPVGQFIFIDISPPSNGSIKVNVIVIATMKT